MRIATRAGRRRAARLRGPALQEGILYTVLGFLDERDDASVARVCKDYAALRRAFVLRCGCDCKQLWNVCYSSDGRYVATDAGRDISIYDSTTGQLCYRHTNYDMGAGREVRALAFSDEPGLTFAAGGIDHVGEVDFCSLYVDGALRHTWQREGVVWAVAFSPGGATLAAGGQDEKVTLYDTTTYEVRKELFRDGEVNAVAFSPDGQRLACGGDDALLAVYDLATGATMRWERPGGNLIFTVKFSPDSSLVVAGNRFMMLAVYDAATGARLRTLHFGGSVESSDFSRCGRWLAVGDFTGQVSLFDVRDHFICRRVLRRGGAVPTVVFSPDSSTIAIGSWDNTVSLYDVETGDLRRRRESRSAVDASKKD